MDKTKQEVASVRLMLGHLGLRARTVRSLTKDKRDPPDVCVSLGRCKIGVEVMEYHRDLSAGCTSHLRGKEATIREMEGVFASVRDEFRNLKAYGAVFFRPSDEQVGGATAERLPLFPPKKHCRDFIRQMLRFASAQSERFPEGDKVLRCFGAEFPLLSKHIIELRLRHCSWLPIWNFDPRAKTHGFSEEVWVNHVQRKQKALAARPERLQGYDELWLLLTAHIRSSQIIAATLDHLREARRLAEVVKQSQFDAIVIHEEWQEGQLWRWRRGAGWDEPRK